MIRKEVDIEKDEDVDDVGSRRAAALWGVSET